MVGISRSLKLNELTDCHQRIRRVVQLINNHRLELVTMSKLSQADSLEISKMVTTLNSRLSTIALGQIDEILTDLQQPRKRIEIVTDKLNAAVKKLEELNEFIKILASLVDLAGKFSVQFQEVS
ncbi:MAG: hypothetical protein HC773_03655 [Scytonema sp. CRU_2_7]|nr:hypothetical protein [Scytonema sp. CRU_2_7]